MNQGDPSTLESALARTQASADAALKAAGAAAGSLKKVRRAVVEGNLRDLRTSLAAAEQTIATLRQEFANARESWDFDEERYLSSGEFAQELVRMAQAMGVQLYEQDDRLYCYPALIRVDPKDRAVLIDKARERRLRPTVLLGQLRDLQKRPPRFKPEAFLESLFEAYTAIAKRQDDGLFGGAVVRLSEIYDLLTLLPSRDYAKPEFARDVYLLDQSGVAATKRGHRVRFPASTGTRAASGTFRVFTQSGQEKVYYGIAFDPPQ